LAAGIIKPKAAFDRLKRRIARLLPQLSDGEREELRRMLE
jgi:hypothetical protein